MWARRLTPAPWAGHLQRSHRRSLCSELQSSVQALKLLSILASALPLVQGRASSPSLVHILGGGCF